MSESETNLLSNWGNKLKSAAAADSAVQVDQAVKVSGPEPSLGVQRAISLLAWFKLGWQACNLYVQTLTDQSST